jgi:hypothetical protein
MRQALIVVAVIAVAGCSSTPVSPSSPLGSSPQTPVFSTGPSAATLAISSFDVRLAGFSGPDGSCCWYRPHLTLTETSGQSAATITSLVFSMPDGASIVVSGYGIPGCFLSEGSSVVPSGGSWNINRLYVYCLDLDTPSEIAGQQVQVTVNFRDVEGHVSSVNGTATVS